MGNFWGMYLTKVNQHCQKKKRERKKEGKEGRMKEKQRKESDKNTKIRAHWNDTSQITKDTVHT